MEDEERGCSGWSAWGAQHGQRPRPHGHRVAGGDRGGPPRVVGVQLDLPVRRAPDAGRLKAAGSQQALTRMSGSSSSSGRRRWSRSGAAAPSRYSATALAPGLGPGRHPAPPAWVSWPWPQAPGNPNYGAADQLAELVLAFLWQRVVAQDGQAG